MKNVYRDSSCVYCKQVPATHQLETATKFSLTIYLIIIY